MFESKGDLRPLCKHSRWPRIELHVDTECAQGLKNFLGEFLGIWGYMK